MTRLQPPAYWLTTEQAKHLRESFQSGRALEVGDFLRNEAKEVSPDGELPPATLYGELLALLSLVGNVPFPASVKTDIPQDRDQKMEMHLRSGICILFDRSEAAASDEAIHEFMKTATDEVLSDPNCNYLILHCDEPEKVREGIDFLHKVFAIPEPYSMALLVLR